MVKVAFLLIYGKHYTGGPRVLVNLLAGLDRSVIEPVAITQRDSPMSVDLEKLNVKVHFLPLRGNVAVGQEAALRAGLFHKLAVIREIYSFNRNLKELLAREAIDCIWVRNSKGVILAAWAAKRLGKPLIWDIGMEKPYLGIMKGVHEIAMRSSSVVVAEAKAVYRNIFPQNVRDRYADKLRVIPSGIHDSRIREIEMCSRDSGAKNYVLCVGSLCKRKNQLFILQALSYLRSKGVRVMAKLAGGESEDGYLDSLKQYSQKHGLDDQVEFLGWREDVPQLICNAACVIIASKNEGVPYTLLETVHASTPIISTPAGGVTDLIQNGVSGFIVDYDDVEQLAACVCKLLNDPEMAIEFTQNARRDVLETYNKSNWLKSYNSLLAQMCHAR